jgi:hypothetical protein
VGWRYRTCVCACVRVHRLPLMCVCCAYVRVCVCAFERVCVCKLYIFKNVVGACTSTTLARGQHEQLVLAHSAVSSFVYQL